MSQQKQNSNIVAIVTMVFLFAMISFVTNLAVPLGDLWKERPALLEAGNFWGKMGNMMNFLAYLFMGIPAGNMLVKLGYKKTALVAVAVGFFGILVQFLSGTIGETNTMFNIPVAFFVYLLGAFISGFSVCMLNTVVNPMLNLLGGGGNKGNQYIQIGGTFNSLVGTLTPMVCGALIGNIVADTPISNVNPVLFTAMGVFAATFIILSFIPIADPEGSTGQTKFERSPWAFRHFMLGVIAIFIYVGVEVGTPGILMSYLSNTTDAGAGLTVNAMATAGFVAGTYWFMMLIGRFIFGSVLGGKVSSKTLLTCASAIGIVLVLLAIFIPKTVTTSMPIFTGSGFAMATVPISALFIVLVGLCTSIMWGGIFNLAVEGLGKYTAQASGIFMMMVVGGGILPLLQGGIADLAGYMPSYWLIIAGMAYMLYYAVVGCKNVNKDIPVD